MRTQPISRIGELLEAEGITTWGVVDLQSAEAGNRHTSPEDCSRPLGAHRSRQYAAWIAEGRQGEMVWLRRDAEAKYRAGRLLPGARSLVSVAMPYRQEVPWPRPEARVPEVGESPWPRVSRYALGRDYHKELGRSLRRISRALTTEYPGHRFRSFTDATPLSERHFAEQAGLGFTGRNTLLINHQLGSWFFLGEIITTLHLPPRAGEGGGTGRCPRSCTRCIDVCPTGALEGPMRINASRCISYLTIEHKETIPEPIAERMAGWIFGCDLCQEVCPLNIPAQDTTRPGFTRHIAGAMPDIAELLSLETHADVVARFGGSPLVRAGRRNLVRNTLIALQYEASEAVVREHQQRISELCADTDEVVREHALRCARVWPLAIAGARMNRNG